MYNINPMFDNYQLYFDEPSHKYTDNLDNDYISTTTILHTYAPAFDKSYWLKKKAKELGISEKRLAQQWQDITDEACTRGTKTHNGLEDGIKEYSLFHEAVKYAKKDNGSMVTIADINRIDSYTTPLDIDKFREATNNKYPKVYEIFKYYVDNGYKIYSEIGAFLPNYLISGCIDILILREDRFVIGDWKTNRGGLKFEAGYFKKDKTQKPHQLTNEWVPKNEGLLPPLAHLPNCNGSIYNLQLSVYAFMVETVLGIPNVGLWLCHIDSDFVLNEYGQPKRFPDGLYHIKKNPVESTSIHKMKYLRNEVASIMKDRSKTIAATRVQQLSLFD